MYEAIDACRSHIIQFGGHKYAAGLTIKEENYKAFKENFEAQVAQTITAVQKEQALEIDLALPFTSITLKLLRVLKQMEPFGPENRSPIFYTEGVRDSGYAKLVGQDKSHLKARFIQGSSSPIDAIGFSLGEKIYLLKKRSPLRIAYSIEENVWHGHVGVQLRLKDVE